MYKIRMGKRVVFFAVVLMLFWTAQSAAAEEGSGEFESASMGSHSMEQGEPRQGFWTSFGLGIGSMGFTGANSRAGVGAAQLEMGGTINPQFLIGGGLNVWVDDYDDSTTMLTVLGRFYPTDDRELYLLGGLGAGILEVGGIEDEGGALLLGGGYDHKVGTSWYVTPALTIGVISFDWTTLNVFQLGVSMTYH